MKMSQAGDLPSPTAPAWTMQEDSSDGPDISIAIEASTAALYVLATPGLPKRASPDDTIKRTAAVLNFNLTSNVMAFHHAHAVQEDSSDGADISVAIEASIAALYVLATPGLPKQAYSEDTIERTVEILKFNLMSNVMAFHDARLCQIHRPHLLAGSGGEYIVRPSLSDMPCVSPLQEPGSAMSRWRLVHSSLWQVHSRFLRAGAGHVNVSSRRRLREDQVSDSLCASEQMLRRMVRRRLLRKQRVLPKQHAQLASRLLSGALILPCTLISHTLPCLLRHVPSHGPYCQ